MIVRTFIDTNVLTYSDDPFADAKRERAIEIAEAARRTGLGVISTQVMQEYFNTTTRKMGSSAEAARQKVVALTRLNVVQVDPALILAGIDLHRLHQFSFWDALIVAAAQAGGCAELLSEDMQHGRQIGGVRIVNPFLPT